MIFEKTYGISDVLSIVSISLVIIGGIFAYHQWRKNMLLKSAAYLNELQDKIRSDPDIKETLYLFEYNEDWYSKQFHGSTLEAKADKTFSCMSYICYLKEQKIISEKEFKFFQYKVERIIMNYGVQDYFYNLYHFAMKFSVPFTFFYLLDYGKKHKLLNVDFFDNKAYQKNNLFHDNLNF